VTGPVAARSLPLDIGAATPLIPAHLRKAAAIRHHHCAFPGCDIPTAACDLHHLIPRSHGGPTSLTNLVPPCHFHHQIAIHRWAGPSHSTPTAQPPPPAPTEPAPSTATARQVIAHPATAHPTKPPNAAAATPDRGSSRPCPDPRAGSRLRVVRGA